MLHLSILATFEGINPAGWWPCDLDIRHMKPEQEHGLSCDSRKISPDKSEYAYDEVWERFCFEPEDEEEAIALSEKESWQGWDELHSVEVSGVVHFSKGMDYLEKIGAFFETENTMGTIGGPLGWHVPDLAFRVESQLVIDSIRVTPCWKDKDGEFAPLSEHSWNRLVRMFKESDSTWRLYKLANR